MVGPFPFLRGGGYVCGCGRRGCRERRLERQGDALRPQQRRRPQPRWQGQCGKGEKKLTISKQGHPGRRSARSPRSARSRRSTWDHCPHPAGGRAAGDHARLGSLGRLLRRTPRRLLLGRASNWINKGAGTAPIGFQKDAAGYVHLQGSAAITRGSGPEPIAIFFLPPGYEALTDGARIFRHQPAACKSARPASPPPARSKPPPAASASTASASIPDGAAPARLSWIQARARLSCASSGRGRATGTAEGRTGSAARRPPRCRRAM